MQRSKIVTAEGRDALPATTAICAYSGFAPHDAYLEVAQYSPRHYAAPTR